MEDPRLTLFGAIETTSANAARLAEHSLKAHGLARSQDRLTVRLAVNSHRQYHISYLETGGNEFGFGGPGWGRTNDQPIMSRPL